MATRQVAKLLSALVLADRGSLLRQSVLLRVDWSYASIFLHPCLGFPWAAPPLFPLSDARSDVLLR
eukprot:1402225-Heterocapsa_arctica.AAC.1